MGQITDRPKALSIAATHSLSYSRAGVPPANPGLRWLWVSAVTLIVLAAITLRMSAQQGRLADPANSLHVPALTFGSQGTEELVGLPDDWTHHHLIFSNPGTGEEAIKAGRYEEWLRIVSNPRYIMQQLKRRAPAQGPGAEYVARMNELAREPQAAEAEDLSARPEDDSGRLVKGTRPFGQQAEIRRDWNESLGATTAPSYASWPAKWSFSTTSASCANDFVIFPTGQAGSATQASIIAYYNLYSGCTTGTVPEVDWAYNTGGTVALAPVFSVSGSQVALVQTSAGAASLVLLKFPLTPPGTGTLASPKAPTSVSAASYPTCAAPCMTTLGFNGGPNDTGSNPYYDYMSDSLFVGAGNGTLHKFQPVFNGTPAEATTSGWPVTLNAANAVASPVYDGTSACVFVGDTGGYLYSVQSGNQGSVCTSASGSVYATSSRLDYKNGIRDAPLVDSVAGRVYVFAGYDKSNNNGVFQLATNFTNSSGNGGSEVTVGSGGSSAFQLAGTFDNVYYTSANPSSPSGNLYMCGSVVPATLYRIPISSNTWGAAITGPSEGAAYPDSGYCSPITEFYNTSSATDYIFFSAYATTGTGAVVSFNVTTPSNFTNTTAPVAELVISSANSSVPTGGIVIDNAVSSPTGTSQVYFQTLDTGGANPCAGICAVQVSQAAL